MSRKYVAVVAVVLLAGLSGCATISVTADVGGADTIDRYEMNISTSTTVYGFLDQAAQEDGYDDVGEMITSNASIPEENFEYSEEIDGQEAMMRVEISDVDVGSMPAISIEETDGQLVYEDTAFYNASAAGAEPDSEIGSEMMSGFVLEYTLEMPGEITESNADEVEGNTATWTRTGGDAFDNTSIEATSEASSSVLSPGFGVIPAIVALLLIGGFYYRSRE